jgi:hypothetical protein
MVHRNMGGEKGTGYFLIVGSWQKKQPALFFSCIPHDSSMVLDNRVVMILSSA